MAKKTQRPASEVEQLEADRQHWQTKHLEFADTAKALTASRDEKTTARRALLLRAMSGDVGAQVDVERLAAELKAITSALEDATSMRDDAAREAARLDGAIKAAKQTVARAEIGEIYAGRITRMARIEEWIAEGVALFNSDSSDGVKQLQLASAADLPDAEQSVIQRYILRLPEAMAWRLMSITKVRPAAVHSPWMDKPLDEIMRGWAEGGIARRELHVEPRPDHIPDLSPLLEWTAEDEAALTVQRAN